MKLRIIAVILLASSIAFAELSSVAKDEISHLFAYLKGSSCEFLRNGSWHSAEDAAGHLNAKYDYFLKRDMISSTEDFIERAATKSSMSGKPYLVRCGGSAPIENAIWLKEELAAYRKSGRNKR